ncbi:MAG: hypothetical protein IPG78_02055 [Ignavibacteria bacterium]|nr:hypothetical protein [Ignavibacteria bacterium]
MISNKKNLLLYISLTVLPVFLYALIVFFRFSIGESFLYSNYDGPYGLLLSSLSIADLRSPGYFQHPAIVPQIITAIVIKLTYLFAGNESNMVLDTFNRPEFYLHKINITFTFLTLLSLIILGVISYRKTGNILAAIFIQFTPFISVQLIFQLAKNTAETTSIILILILLTFVFCLLNEKSITKRRNIGYAIVFGIICGLALANKISFLPVMIIPFLLIKNIRFKGLFVLISFVTFLILFLSMSPERAQFFKSLFINVFQSGVYYSSGPANFADSSQIVMQFMFIFYEYSLFSVVYLIIMITLILQFIPKLKLRIRSNKYFLLLVGIFIIETAFISLVIKTHVGYYILPALMFSVTGLFAVNSIFLDLFPKFFRISNYLYKYIFIIVFLILQISAYRSITSFYNNRKKESYKIVKYLEDKHNKSLVVSTDFVSSIPTAFYHSLFYTGEQRMYYYSILKKKYPNFVYFNKWRKDFTYLDYDKELKNRLLNSDTLVFHSYKDENFNDFKERIVEYTKKQNTTFREVFSNKNGEKIYLVNLK